MELSSDSPNKCFFSLLILIQGQRRVKDFDIEREAKGVDKAVIRNFTAEVINKTLEIRFQFTGKGTTAIPIRGTYGPMISAISVVSGTIL